ADKGSRQDRSDLGEIGLRRRYGAREYARIDRQVVAILAGGGFAVTRHVRFKQLSLGVGLSLQCVQFDLLLPSLGRLRLQLVEIGSQLVLARLRGLCFGGKALQHLLRLGAYLAVEVGELRSQGTDAGMV